MYRAEMRRLLAKGGIELKGELCSHRLIPPLMLPKFYIHVDTVVGLRYSWVINFKY